MVEQRQQFDIQPESNDESNVFSSWNICTGSFSNTSNGEKLCCTDQHVIRDAPTERCDAVAVRDDDDVSILESGQELPSCYQRQAMVPIQTPHSVRKIMNGFLAPIMNCVHPKVVRTTSVAEPVLMYHTQYRIRRTDSSIINHCTVPSNTNIYSLVCKRSYSRSSTGNNEKIITSEVEGTTGKPNAPLSSSQINANDVLCGRGNRINRHAGNVHFRELISVNKNEYSTLTKKEKMMLAHQIVNLVLFHTNPPGRFVSRDAATGLWSDIGLSFRKN